MPKKTQDLEEFIMTKIRQVTLRDPTMATTEIMEKLNGTRYGEAPIILTWRYVDKLRQKITRRRAYLVGNSIIPRINEMRERATEVQRHLWMEVEKAEKSAERTLALREIVKIDDTILQAEMDAGIYQRNLGSVRVDERKILVANIINETDEHSRQQFIEALKTNLDGGGGENARLQVRSTVLDRERDLPDDSSGDGQNVEIGEAT